MDCLKSTDTSVDIAVDCVRSDMLCMAHCRASNTLNISGNMILIYFHPAIIDCAIRPASDALLNLDLRLASSA